MDQILRKTLQFYQLIQLHAESRVAVEKQLKHSMWTEACPTVAEYLNMKADEKYPSRRQVSLPCEEVTFLKQHSLNLILCTEFGKSARGRDCV